MIKHNVTECNNMLLAVEALVGLLFTANARIAELEAIQARILAITEAELALRATGERS